MSWKLERDKEGEDEGELIEVCWSTRTRGYTRTRPVPAGMGRVRVDVLRVGSVRVRSPWVGYTRFLPIKNTIFYDVGAISNVFYFFLFSGYMSSSVRLSVVCLSVCRL